LGGSLELTESSPEKGSTFTLTIQPGSASEEARLAPSVETPDTGFRLDDVRILVAEDHPDNLDLVTHFLKEAGAKIEAAHNGAEAVALARSQPFDVVLMDLQMPVMDGYRATETLRKEGYRVPIVALTAHAMIEEKEKCLAIGCNDFLTKPLDVALLLKTLRKHLKR
jgi:CheY-like chemotaxis protein